MTSEGARSASLAVIFLTLATAGAADWSGYNPWIAGIAGFFGWIVLIATLQVLAEIYLPPPPAPAREAGMRVVGYRMLSEFVAEVTTESEEHGRVTQRVLILPESKVNEWEVGS